MQDSATQSSTQESLLGIDLSLGEYVESLNRLTYNDLAELAISKIDADTASSKYNQSLERYIDEISLGLPADSQKSASLQSGDLRLTTISRDDLKLFNELNQANLRLEYSRLKSIELRSFLTENLSSTPDFLTTEPSQIGFSQWFSLAIFAWVHGFTVTGSNEKKGHNSGSLHYEGRAIDVRTRNKTADEVNALIAFLMKFHVGIKDERLHPPGQKVWTAPHLHLDIPKHDYPRRYTSPLFNPAFRAPEN